MARSLKLSIMKENVRECILIKKSITLYFISYFLRLLRNISRMIYKLNRKETDTISSSGCYDISDVS